MRHRIVSGTGLGNPDSPILGNTGKLDKRFARSAILHYFIKEEGFDYEVTKDYVKVGYEPAYQYERLKVITIHKNKRLSSIKSGKAWGGYGTQIAATEKIYAEYVNNCKFTRFVDRWHPILFGRKK